MASAVDGLTQHSASWHVVKKALVWGPVPQASWAALQFVNQDWELTFKEGLAIRGLHQGVNDIISIPQMPNVRLGEVREGVGVEAISYDANTFRKSNEMTAVLYIFSFPFF